MMRTTDRRLLRLLSVTVATVSVGLAVGLRDAGAQTVDGDLFAVSGNAVPTDNVALIQSSTSYTLSGPNGCLALGVPNFVDVPPDESGPCTSLSGGGSFDISACSTGTISAAWSMGEPLGDTATFNGSGVMIGGVTVISTEPGGAFTDDGSSGPGALVGVFVPAACLTGGNDLAFSAVVAGEY